MKEYIKEAKAYKCLNCGKTGFGRAGRKFCSQECKNAWHNALVRDSRLYRSRILTALGRNYSVLSEALARGELSIDIISMENRGFRPCYITGYIPGRYRGDRYRCFDISYCRSASRVYNIRKEEGD